MADNFLIDGSTNLPSVVDQALGALARLKDGTQSISAVGDLNMFAGLGDKLVSDVDAAGAQVKEAFAKFGDGLINKAELGRQLTASLNGAIDGIGPAATEALLKSLDASTMTTADAASFANSLVAPIREALIAQVASLNEELGIGRIGTFTQAGIHTKTDANLVNPNAAAYRAAAAIPGADAEAAARAGLTTALAQIQADPKLLLGANQEYLAQALRAGQAASVRSGVFQVGDTYLQRAGTSGYREVTDPGLLSELDTARARDAQYAADRSTFGGGFQRGIHGRGDTFGSSLAYHAGSQLEFAMSAGMGYLAFTGAADALKQIKEYSAGQADLNAAMQAQPGGNGAGGNYLNSLANVSRAVGENAQQSFDSAAQGIRMYSAEIQKSGDTTGRVAQQIGMATAQAAAQLGVITKEGQQKATGQLLSIASSFGLDYSQFGQINDAIAYARTHVGGDTAQIAEGVQGFSKGAAFAGMNVDETAVLMGLLQARTGDSGSALANRMNRIMQNVGGAAGDKLAAQYGNAPGVDAADQKVLLNASSTGLQRLAALADVFSKASQQTQNQMAAALGGNVAGTEAKALLSEWKDTIAPNFAQVDSGKANGAAAAQFAALMDTVGMKLKQLGADLSNLVNDIARSDIAAPIGALVQALGPLVNAVDEVVRVFDMLPDSVKTPVMAIAEAGAAYAIYNRMKGASDTNVAAAADRAALGLNEVAGASERAAIAETGMGGNMGAGLMGRFGDGRALAGLGGLGLLMGGQYMGGQAGSVMSDAGTGALLGSFIGPEGALIGGLLGGSYGMISNAIGNSDRVAAQSAQDNGITQAAQAAASQNIAAGNFAAAVKNFQDGVAKLTNNPSGTGLHGQSNLLKDQGNLLAAFTSDNRYIADLGAPISAGTSKGDQIVAGEQAMQHQKILQNMLHQRGNPTDAIGRILAGAAPTASFSAPWSTPTTLNGKPYDPSDPAQAAQLNAILGSEDSPGGNGVRAMDPSAAAKHIASVVSAFIAKNGQKMPSDAEVIALIKQALPGVKAQWTSKDVPGGDAIPGISTAAATALVPQIKAAIQSGGTPIADIMNALTSINNNSAPQIIATLNAMRQAAIDHSKSDAYIRSVNVQYGKQMLAQAGTDPALIRTVLGNLDQATINQITAGIQSAEQAEQSLLAMHKDIVNALAAANAVMSAVSSLSAGLIGDTTSMVTGMAAQMTHTSTGQVAQVQKAQADLAANKTQLSAIHAQMPTVTPAALPAAPKGRSGGGGAGHQYDYVKSAIAEARAARAGGADIAAAQAAIQAAQDQMDHNATGTAAWWRAYAALWQAKQQLVKAEATNAETTFMLSHDYTDPIIQALAKARNALTVLEQERKLGFSKEEIHKDALAYDQAQATLTQTKQSEALQSYQTQEQLGLISHAAYIQYLESQKKIMDSMKNKTYAQTQYMYQIDQALLSANQSTNAMWNLGDINTNGLVAQVRAIGDLVKQVNGLGPFNNGIGTYRPRTDVVVTIKGLPSGVTATTQTKSPLTTSTRNPRP